MRCPFSRVVAERKGLRQHNLLEQAGCAHEIKSETVVRLICKTGVLNMLSCCSPPAWPARSECPAGMP